MNIKFKNYLSILSIFSVTILLSSAAQAGNVGSTFTDGNPLTGAQMTEIKDAVNDNDTNTTAVDINATTSSAPITADGSTNTAMQVSVIAPADGFVLVTFTASAETNHTTGAKSFLRYFLADAEIAHSFIPSWQAIVVPAANPTSSGEFRSISTQRLFTVTAATAHTFYARFNIFSGNDWTVFRPYMSAVFIPITTGALPAQF